MHNFVMVGAQSFFGQEAPFCMHETILLTVQVHLVILKVWKEDEWWRDVWLFFAPER